MRVKKHVLIVLMSAAAALLLCEVTEDSSETVLRALRSAARGNSLRTGPEITVDSRGVPSVDYGRQGGLYVGKQKNPLVVARHGLDYYSRYIGGEQTAKAEFLTCADWLMAHAVRRGHYAVLEYTFPWPGYKARPPWRSAMAQAPALRVLARAHDLTGRAEYEECAKAILAIFFVDVINGGVTRKDSDTRWWYEECTAEGALESRVLNGMMYTLLDLYDYHKWTGDGDALLLFDRGIAALEEALPRYDRGGYSSYDALGQPAFRYHRVHVALLDRLHAITRSRTLKIYHDRWAAYAGKPFAIRVITGPDKAKLGVLGLNVLALVALSESATFLIRRWRRPRVVPSK